MGTSSSLGSARRPLGLSRAALVVALATATGCGDDGVGPRDAGAPDDLGREALACDVATVQAALRSAAPGALLRLAAGCRLEGSLELPAGVSLEGAGVESSTLAAAGGDFVVRLSPGEPATTLRAVAIESGARAAVVAEGAGALRVEQVRVSALGELAVSVEGATAASLVDLELAGTATEPTCARPPCQGAAYGLVLTDVADAELSRLTAHDFGTAAVLATRSSLRWSGGTVGPTSGGGIVVAEGEATMSDVAIRGLTRSSDPLAPGAGLLASDGARVDTTDLVVANGGGAGVVLRTGATGRHVGLTLDGIAGECVRVLCADAVLEDASISGCGGHGLEATGTGSLALRRVEVRSTHLAVRAIGFGSIEVGDGVAVVEPRGAVELSDVTLAGNERVGLLLQPGAQPVETLELTRVVVDAPPGAYGALLLDADGVLQPSGSWDADLERRGAAAEVDAAAVGSRFEPGPTDAICSR